MDRLYADVCAGGFGRLLVRDQLRVCKSQHHGTCPVCGSAPILSLLEDEGRRKLVCSFCWYLWPAKRVQCPYCDGSGSDDMHYFYSEAEKDTRVDLCDICQKYIKTIDTRKTARLIYPPLEHISTMHLDIKAQEMGFGPGIRLFMQA